MARFRIRTSQGQELSFASHEMFEEFVRSGDLAPDDLVYDAETREWAPSRTHPLVLEIQYAEEEAEEAAAAASEPTDASQGSDDFGLSLADAPPPPESDALAAADGDGAFGLELAPPAEGRSAEEESAAFVERMETERALEREFGHDSMSSMQGFRMEDSNTFADMIQAEPDPEPEPEPERPRGPPARRPKIKVARPKKKKSALPKLVAGVVVLGLLGVAGYFGRSFVSPPPAATDPVDTLVVQPTVEPEPEPEPEPEIASTEEAVRNRAQERFLATTEVLLDELPPIPESWLTGPYFQLPSEHAEVREVWQLYRSTVRRVRTDLAARYRQAYQAALDDAAVRDPEAREARTQAAVGDFALKLPDVDAHWDRVEELAVAAVQSHDALLGAEGLVLYDGTGNTGRAEGIGRGTSARDSDTELLIDQVIDLMERTLDAEGRGPREGSNVREWVWGGFVDAITR